MATTRRTRKAPSTTTRKSSETQTEKPQSDSKASEKASDETSTETSSSSRSSDDDEALFEEADAKAAQEAEDDATEDEDQDDADEPEEDVAEGEVTTFEVDPGYGKPYTFKGVVNGNTIVVTEDALQEFTLPGSKKLGQKMAHHKGQLLPLASYKPFIKGA